MHESRSAPYRGNILVFGTPTLVALWFVYSFALTYLTTNPNGFGIYQPRRQWLYAHVLAGVVALLLGPLQFWLGLNQRTSILHRILGIGYVTSVGVGGTAAFYLAFHTDFGWVFGLGLAGMASTWIISTTLGTVSIVRHQVEQHREWMIRSYVVTFAFVTFRVLDAVFDMAKLGTMVERMTAASWLGWAVPLLITEAVLQGRKIFSKPANAKQPRVVSADSVVPEPMAFDLQSPESSYQRQP